MNAAFAAVNYSKIDTYAKRAPVLKNNGNLNRLVQYLVRPYQTDTEKARVLLAWIVYNIDYDGYKLNGNVSFSSCFSWKIIFVIGVE